MELEVGHMIFGVILWLLSGLLAWGWMGHIAIVENPSYQGPPAKALCILVYLVMGPLILLIITLSVIPRDRWGLRFW